MSPEFKHLWRWPIVLGWLTASGLVSALLSDHWGDWWSWLSLGLPVVVMLWYGFCSRLDRASRKPKDN